MPLPGKSPPAVGFSQLELVVVCAVVAILLTLAVPVYQQYMMRSYRGTAVEAVLAAAACQQRIYAAEFSYHTGRCTAQPGNGRYRLRYEPADTESAEHFTVIAEPQGVQTGDICGSLMIDQAGQRSISGPAARQRSCWEGR